MPNVNVFMSKDIRYIAQKMIRVDTPAKASKTLVGHMNTVLRHVRSLAKNGTTSRDRLVRSIASKELTHQHELFVAVKGQNLPAKAAQAMKDGMLGAFKKILNLF